MMGVFRKIEFKFKETIPDRREVMSKVTSDGSVVKQGQVGDEETTYKGGVIEGNSLKIVTYQPKSLIYTTVIIKLTFITGYQS